MTAVSKNDSIKAIAFDWGGVLIENPSPGFLRLLAGRFQCSEEELAPHLQSLMDRFQRGVIAEKHFLVELAEKLNRPPDPKPFWKDALRAVYKEQPEVIDMARSLKANGYAVGLLSNTEVSAREFHLECGYDFFDARIFSCDEGLAKPERAIYELTAERLGVAIHELLMIDDKAENIAGAVDAGACGILYEDPSQLVVQLESCGIRL